MRDERKPEDFIGKSVRSGEERSAMPNTFVSEDSAIEDGGFPGDLQIPSLAPRKKEKRCIKNPIVSNESGSPQQNMEEQVSVKNEKAVDSREAKESEENIAAKKMGASEIAEILMSEHRFCSDGSQLYLYDIQDGYWKMLQESEANREIRKLIPENVRSYVNKIVLREIYEWIRIDASPSSGDADRRKDYINFKDCAVNWQTGKICKAREKLYFTYALKVEYVKGNPMPKGAYHDFLKDIFGHDQDTKREFRKFLGLCLSDIRNLKTSAFLYGPSNSGKTVMLNLLKGMMGEELCTSLSFTQMSSEFAITQLLGKRLNLSGEVSGASNKRLDIFKSLTGNDTLTACFKGKDHFQFKNECLMVFACNSFPSIQAIEEFDSFLERIIIFPFTNVKPRSQWINGLENLLLEDSGEIIKDAMKGLREMEEDGFVFNESVAMRLAKEEFIGQYNSFSLFALRFIEADAGSVVTSEEIQRRYRNFCQNEDCPVLEYTVWSKYLKKVFHCTPTTKEIEDGLNKRRVRAYRGICLKKCSER